MNENLKFIVGYFNFESDIEIQTNTYAKDRNYVRVWECWTFNSSGAGDTQHLVVERGLKGQRRWQSLLARRLPQTLAETTWWWRVLLRFPDHLKEHGTAIPDTSLR